MRTTLITLPFLLLLFSTYGQKIDFSFPRELENTIISFNFIGPSYYSTYPYRKDFTFDDTMLGPFETGYVSVYDTIKKRNLIQIPLFTDQNLKKITVSNFTLNPDSLSQVISYHESEANDLNMLIYLARSFAFRNYGIKDGKITYLDKQGEDKLFWEQLDIIKKNPNNIYSLYFLKYQMDLSKSRLTLKKLDEIQNNFNQFSDVLKSSSTGIKLSNNLSEYHQILINNQIGQFSPKFIIKGIDANNYSNDYFVNKPYIIAFSAVWCEPCKENIPLLKNLYKKYKNQGLEVLYVNLDNDKAKWIKMVQQYEMKWLNASELKKFGTGIMENTFNVTSIPNYILIDRNGKIVYNDALINDSSFSKLESYILQVLEK